MPPPQRWGKPGDLREKNLIILVFELKKKPMFFPPMKKNKKIWAFGRAVIFLVINTLVRGEKFGKKIPKGKKHSFKIRLINLGDPCDPP